MGPSQTFGQMRTTARMAGFLYLLIIVGGLFSELFVRSGIIVPGDATTTVENISDNFFQRFDHGHERRGCCSFALSGIKTGKQRDVDACSILQVGTGHRAGHQSLELFYAGFAVGPIRIFE